MIFRLSASLLVSLALTGVSSAFEPFFSKSGTGTYLHPLQVPEVITLPSCYAERPSRCCKDHVYIFGVNGLNPMCLGNFNGMLNYFREQGFEHTYFGQLYTCHTFAAQIREIRRTDPEAKVVLIGFSLGCNFARNIANQLAAEDCRVDVLVYLVGDLVGTCERSWPRNVDRVVDIRGTGLVLLGGDLFLSGQGIEGASVHHLHCRHILAPSRRETLEIMMNELLMLACFPETPK